MSLVMSSRVYRHSVDVLQQHRKLLVFPLLSMLAWLALFAWFLLPTLNASGGQAWNWLRPPALARVPRDVPLVLLAGFYLCGMFASTFTSAAFCSQALCALNGGPVSISRGFALAIERLPAIAAWSLFGSTIGALLRGVEVWLGFVAQWAIVLLGVGWSAASQFVIPIMLKEPRNRNPLDYLKISARILRPVWGDGLSYGTVGAAYPAGIAVMCVMVAAGMASLAAHRPTLLLGGALISCGILFFAHALTEIFRCGLYIFATEGVAPGPFDDETLNSAWTVR